jgi:phenylacetic acid degradation operon negative regulatory protein
MLTCNTLDVVSESSPQELVLTLIGSYVRPRTRPLWAGGLVAALGEFGYSPGAARVALTRLTARDVLVRSTTANHASYSITGRAETILAEGDARIFALGRSPEPADSTGIDPREWTVLWHTVPEERKVERGRLTRRLRFLGFGPLQDATWIAPRNHRSEVAAVLEEMDLRDHAAVWIGQPATERDIRGIVARVWDLDHLSRRYQSFVRNFAPYADGGIDKGGQELNDRQAHLVRTRLVHTFRQFPALDPELPESLVPPPPHRSEAVDLFHDVFKALAEPAQRHFDKVISP